VPRRSPRDVAVSALQYGLAVAAVWWVLSGIDVGELAALLGQIDGGTALAVVVVTLVGLVGRFDTWRVLLGRVGAGSVRDAASVDLAVYFLNQLLPSRLSGRVAAPFVVRARTGVPYADAAAVSGVHTGLYAVLYGVVAAIGVVAGATRLSRGVLALLALSTALYLAAGGAVLLAGYNLTVLDRLVDGLEGLARRLPRVGDTLASRVGGLRGFTADSREAFRRLGGDPGLWLRYAAGWAIFAVLAPGGRVLLLLAALGAPFEPAVLLPLYLVAAYSVTLLPLTPGGIGVTEATATVVFVALGVPEAIAVSVIFADRALGVYLPALCGWYPAATLDLDRLKSGEN